jgi:alpha-tubulin suppressor-like RCC1 family protein
MRTPLAFFALGCALFVPACIVETTSNPDGGTTNPDGGTTNPDGGTTNPDGGGGGNGPELKSLSAGSEMTCAVVVDGTARCWGRNNVGQLGNGSKTFDPVVRPVKVSGLTDAVAISAGYEYACALKADGTVVCWGGNALGVLGNGTTTDSTTPVGVTGLSGVKEIAAGFSATCALKTDGTVWCWGRGGDYGSNALTQSNVPVQVAGLANVQHIANANEGGQSLSSLVCALLGDKTVQCFSNYNGSGQLGNGTQNSSRTPAPVTGIADATAITASLLHACAVRADGTWCWGASQTVGDGTVEQRLAPVKATTTLFAELSSGFEHTCGREAGGAVWCWGANNRGQSGDGAAIKVSDYRLSPAKSNVTDATLLSAGMFHNCVYTKSKRTLCWGANEFGELGWGTPSSSERSSVPTEVVW